MYFSKKLQGTVLEKKDIENMKSVGDFCDEHKLAFIGPECPVCSIESIAEAEKNGLPPMAK